MASRPTAPGEALPVPRKPSPWLLAALGTALVGAAGVAAFAAWMLLRPPSFVGPRLEPPSDALDFQLTDQFGQQVRLSAFSPGVVVLTFIYTSC